MDTVLVIGDSFVDENWLAAKFDTYHSYNVGIEHYISNLPDTNVRVLSLCGAASVWRMLNGGPLKSSTDLPKPLKDNHHLLGVSAWNPLDHDHLLCLLCPIGDERKHVNPYLLSGLRTPTEINGRFKCPYADRFCKKPPFINLIEKSNESINKTSTNRLIRVYSGFGGDQPTLQYRDDWRLPLLDKYKKNQKAPNSERSKIIEEIIHLMGNSPLKAIVVVDHGYGVMNEEFVKKLHDQFKEAQWYIRSKVDSPNWLKFLCDNHAKIRLAFTDEQLMRYKYGTRIWSRGEKVIGRGALEALGDLLGLQKFKHTELVANNGLYADNAALLLDDDTAVGAAKKLDSDWHDAVIVNIHQPPGPLHPIRVGRSTVFFASLVYWDLKEKNADGLNERTIKNAFHWSLRNAYNWTQKCTEAWLEIKPSQLSGPFDNAIYSLPIRDRAAEPISTQPPPYKTAWAEWVRSSKNLGVLTYADDKLVIPDDSASNQEIPQTSDGEDAQNSEEEQVTE